MSDFGLFEDERGVGEHREVAPAVVQFALAGACLRVQAFDPAHDQPGGDRVARAFEGAVYGFGALRVGDPPLFVSVPDRLAASDVAPPAAGHAMARGAALRVDAAVDRAAAAV